jgi:cysteine synthase
MVIAIVMQDDVSEEKEKVLRALGADVERVRPASIVDKNNVCVFSHDTTSNLIDFNSML